MARELTADLDLLASHFPGSVDAALILGSGLGAFAKTFRESSSCLLVT